MLKSYLLTLYRSVVKHRLSSALNIAGLAVGLAVFLVLTLATRFEQSYDRWIPDASRIWRVDGVMRMPGRPEEVIGLIPGPMLPNLKADFGQIENGVRIVTADYAVKQGDRADYEEVLFADPSFFDVFRLPLVEGDAAAALADTSSLVVSQEMARKYFGPGRALGKRLTIVTDGTPRDFRVAAVLKDLPENTHLKIGLMARLEKSIIPDRAEYLDQWNATNYATYVRVTDDAAAAAMDKALPAFLQRRAGDSADWFGAKLERLTDIHFNTDPLGAWKPGADRRLVVMLQIVGVLTLLLALINYVNLSTARAGLRAREVALRKVFGATRAALITQFLTEAVALTLLAGLIALALVELSLPMVNTALGLPLDLHYLGSDGVLPLFLPLTLGVGLVAGFYPALVISRFEPAAVLAASRAPGGGRGAAAIREVLVVAQFAVSIGLLICTGVVFAQSDFVRKADLGFQRDKLILVQEVGGPDVIGRTNTLIDAMGRLPGVVSTTVSGRYPGRGGVGRSSSFTRPGMQAADASLSWEPVGDRYMETYGIPLVAGRRFNPLNRADDATDISDAEAMSRGINIIINEAAAKALEFRRPADAVGVTLRGGDTPWTVIGVAKDARYGSPREKVPPIMYYHDVGKDGLQQGDTTIAVRYRGDAKSMMARLQNAWRGVVPEKPFKAQTVEASLDAFYQPEERRSRLITLGAVVAAMLGCLGLYGLAAFSSERRTKEIGVRKVLGASSRDIFRLLVGQFLRPVVVANLIAWPIAFVLLRGWLSSFDQHVALNLGFFLVATAVALAVALATVTGQALKAARYDPGRALRHD